jgi:hypothetical protein
VFEPKVLGVFAEKLLPKEDVGGLPKDVGVLPKLDVLVLPKVVPAPKLLVGAVFDPKALVEPKEEGAEDAPKPPKPLEGVEGEAVAPKPKEKEGAGLFDPKVNA